MLSFIKIFLVVAEIGLPVPTHPLIRHTQSFNRVVHRRLWAKVHKICYTYKAHRVLFTVKIWWGLQQTLFGESQKFTNFISSQI